MNGSDDDGAAVPSAHEARMDAMYRIQRHFYDATRAYYLLGRDELLQRLAPPPGGTVLEIGCGTGRNLVRAARLYPHARLVGIDISGEMLKSAGASPIRYGLMDRVELFQADATSLASHGVIGARRFDRIYFSYTLSMIPDWRHALDSAAELLAPEGRLLIVDFGNGRGLPGFFVSALHRWLAAFHVTPRDDLREAVAGLAETRRLSASIEPRHRDYAVLATVG